MNCDSCLFYYRGGSLQYFLSAIPNFKKNMWLLIDNEINPVFGKEKMWYNSLNLRVVL